MSHNSTTCQPALIGLDWGSTQVRAFLYGQHGRLLDSMQAPLGVSHHPGAAGVAAVEAWLAAWLQTWRHVPVLACGMVGSQQGWQLAPYLPTPLPLATLGRHVIRLEAWGRTVAIVPGVCHDNAGDGFRDVMRGEETQLAGLAAAYPELVSPELILTPGTHNKWLQLHDGQLLSLSTCMTGELYALLREYSLLAPLLADGPFDSAQFLAGVDCARDKHDWLHQLFGVRARGVQRQLGAAALNDWLSGLLIGYEIHAVLAASHGVQRCGLIGAPALVKRYATALKQLGIVTVSLDGDRAASAGLWRIACQAGLCRQTAANPVVES
ncbi:2-dehydro-3-deoxygalactonokinase [Vogesella oryzae]|uniref:2-dehydro-3-deoxygalactonokinase n=1 Tax=Vogesella oryzae TaxID=1735285 RepID=UPI00158301BB|nr:2-dehydro-3-deoxygalactonokinase [Vogesella oryzae]